MTLNSHLLLLNPRVTQAAQTGMCVKFFKLSEKLFWKLLFDIMTRREVQVLCYKSTLAIFDILIIFKSNNLNTPLLIALVNDTFEPCRLH